jgi:hypothetical protein
MKKEKTFLTGAVSGSVPKLVITKNTIYNYLIFNINKF